MLRQIDWGVQNGPFTKNGVLSVITLFFTKLCFSLKPRVKSLFDVPSTQMSVFILFESVRDLFEGAVSLNTIITLSGFLKTFLSL